MEIKINTDELEWKEGRVKNFFGKELLNMDNGTFKLVKVAPHSGYPEHLHPDKTEFIYVLKGFPEFTIGADKYSAQPNEFYIFPADVKHAILNHSDDECVLMVGGIKK